ncbi:2-succinyl-5-enolpyruvyl-6-hydroxy-3-cyclohexene-1-carboxylic-acid synthase [Propionibacteriaceae bacterium Y1700]|uniref:2-succinyl-5-enolpyruvyl-6-hydroxy-3- cyclohexene-1-carboxylic-acid synthase n=1 Tax=Microlunatus sp. Y1700 TaxID=3418487 RepID=UPI003DA75BD8
MNPSEHVAGVIIATLVERGVRDVVLAPGSRSAPLAYALWRVRDRVRLHVRIDERSAGFTALGLAKVTGLPVPVITTSGTAVGNLMPAVMEAWNARVPLFVISADRPSTMINTGANQTTEQVGLFGRHVRAAARLSARDAEPQAWSYGVDRLVQLASGVRGSVPGPVHLNVELVDPLTPAGGSPSGGLLPAVSSPTLGPAMVGPRIMGESTKINCMPGTVVVAGDLPVAQGRAVADLAAQAAVPLLAEPSSNARHGRTAISTYRLLLGTGLAERIDQVIMVGHPTLSRPVQRLLARDDVRLVVVAPEAEWESPAARADQVVGSVALAGAGDPAWLAAWQQADDRLLERLAADPGTLGTASAVIGSLGEESALVLGSSNPIRDADLVRFTTRARVYANRGLAGIDGTIATAVGVALADQERATTAFMGDLTFVHDSNGLVIGPEEPRPEHLRIVVANDDGGSIFATLEYGAEGFADSFERLFATPHRTDLSALAAASGATFHRVEDQDQLPDLLATPPVGIEVVEVVTDRTDRHTQASRWSDLATAAVADAD